jgi:HAD superfamily hydrolase (TIGR01509 family)
MNEAFRCKAVIYDCDGVLFNSLEANCSFYEAVFNHMGVSLDRSDEDVMRIIHTYANRDVLKYFFPETDRWEKSLRFAGTINYLNLIHLMEMESGLLETLEHLKGKLHLAICTNRSSSMDAVLEGFNLTDYFSYVMTAAKASFPKPHPDPLLRILAHYGIKAEEALFVGDSVVDSLAAAAAGVPFVAYRAELQGIARIDAHEEILALI